MKLKPMLLFAFAAVLSSNLSAASNTATDRWFEVEVILFSQLGDKSQLKEYFSQSTDLPKYRQIKDMLTPHLSRI